MIEVPAITEVQDAGRYFVGEKLIGVAFEYPDGSVSSYPPLMFDDIMPVKVLFQELTVTEQHKVPPYYDPESESSCRGYKLVDGDGGVWLNQYPKASYGQLDGSADYLFKPEVVAETRSQIHYHLLEHRLDSIYRGVRDLTGMVNDPDSDDPSAIARKTFAQHKLPIIQQLKDFVEAEFKKVFPNKGFKEEPVWADHPDITHVVIVDI